MKAEVLMIGDWVLYNETPQQVLEISGIDDEVYLETDELVHQSEIQPIPLTKEILEKNGFYYDEDRKAYLMGVIFRVKPERYGLFSFEICGCPYSLNTVHELQHALRLCGITREIII